MTIVLFLVDTSASMAQKTYQGTSLLDTARTAVELFIKQRLRDASARGDRYMLMSFEEFPMNVKAGWREGQVIFQEQLKLLRPRGLTTFGTALGSAFRFVNVNRLQTGIDNYGCGRYPFYMEPVVVVSITDGNSLTCPMSGVVTEIKLSKPTAMGNELTEEPFRWDHRLFTLVLRLSGGIPRVKLTPGMPLPVDNSPINAMCMATGGRSYSVTSHKLLPLCIESIVQKIQQLGVLVHFEKVGSDPMPIIADKSNGGVENGARASDIESSKQHQIDDAWRNLLTTIYSRATRAYPGHWPIPEAFWPSREMSALPPRKAHPVISFRCEASEPLVCQDFPFDKYELEPSPLTQFILERKQPNVCWQAFVSNSNSHGSVSAPFGYLKASTNLLSVNFFIMPYNYPVLLPLIDELKQDSKVCNDQSWRMRLEKYLRSVPSYYMQPLKKAFARLGVTNSLLEPDQGQQYSYNILKYLAKTKHVAREEFDSQCASIANALQHSIPPPITQIMLTPRKSLYDTSSRKKYRKLPSSEYFKGYQIQIGKRKIRAAPSLQFRNPFEIKRDNLVEQLGKMNTNLFLNLDDRKVPVLEGGLPGTIINLQNAEDLHSLPVGQMGNYQDYVKGLEAIGRGPLREVEPQAIRVHAFGNPFKIDKKSIAVDEVGDGNILSSSSVKVDGPRKRTLSTASLESSRPPRRKVGPLSSDSVAQWRKRRREWSSNSSTVSSSSDLESISSLKDDTIDGDPVHPSTYKVSNGDTVSNGYSAFNDNPSLQFPVRQPYKRSRLINAEKTLLSIINEIEDLSLIDQKRCLLYALREAGRFRTSKLVDALSKTYKQLPRLI
uniref:VWFA domain-containing protein n=1 Tax=Syphacia muris TaxID=451379 RepID=A0A158R5X2_9BILA